MVTKTQINNSNTNLHLTLNIVTTLFHHKKTNQKQQIVYTIQDNILNLYQIKLHDQQRLTHKPLKKYPQYPNNTFNKTTPQTKNTSNNKQPK